MRHDLLGGFAGADCEALRGGLLEQPVNALTSVAFAALGILLITSAIRHDPDERLFRRVFGLVMIVAGAGSFLYHGSSPGASSWLHDIGLVAVLALPATINGAVAVGASRPLAWAGFAAAVALAGTVLAVAPAATNALTATAVVGLVVCDGALHRRRLVDPRRYLLAAGIVTLALAALLLGRTGWPLCHPEALLQGHGLWHVLAASALVIHVGATTPARNRVPVLR